MLRKFLIPAFLALVASPPVLANPDVWVTTNWHVQMAGHSVTGLTLDWTFDAFASSYLFTTFDADGDGTVTNQEAQAKEDELFAPIAEQDWYLTILGDGAPVSWHLQHVEPVFEPDHFGLKLTVSFDGLQAPFAASLHDDVLFFDFSFAGDDFLTVEGPVDPACRFVAGPGEGALEGHTSTITLRCGDPS
ncbi:MAG: DUF1007 family protein [bacterium]|nr:DUF1007 family protein [bacterium]